MKPSIPPQDATGLLSLPKPRGWILPAAAIVALALLVCLPAMRGGFVWDDHIFLVHNPLIKAPDGLRRIWFTQESADYFPLTSSLLWIEWRFWTNHPAGYHVVNVLLHAACAVLLWRLLRRLGVPGAWLAGVLFAVHPVAAASAAWITELKNTLSLLFCAASVLAYLKFDDATSQKAGKCEGEKAAIGPARCFLAFPRYHLLAYLLSLALFLLALLAKTSVVMLPAVLLLCVWWRRGGISRTDLLRSAPFFVLSLALGLVTVWFQQHSAIHGAIVRPEGAASRLAAAGWIAWFYLYKLLLPVGLCAIYPRWNVDVAGLLSFLPLLLLAAGLAWLWAGQKRWGRAPLFAAAYFLTALLPVLGFFNMSFMWYSLVADHLQYLAMIGILAFVAGLLARAAAAGGGAGRAGTVGAAGCVAILCVLTWRHASTYADDKLLWRDNTAKNPASWAAWNNLGNACSAAGLNDEAIRSLSEAIRLKPSAKFYYNRARAYAAAGRYAEAVQDSDQAIARKEDFPAAYNNRGFAYAGMGRTADALRDYDKAIALAPDLASAYCNRGDLYFQDKRFAEAVHEYDQAIALNPDYPPAYNNRAVAHYRRKEYDKALADMKKFLELGGTPAPGLLKELRKTAARAE